MAENYTIYPDDLALYAFLKILDEEYSNDYYDFQGYVRLKTLWDYGETAIDLLKEKGHSACILITKQSVSEIFDEHEDLFERYEDDEGYDCVKIKEGINADKFFRYLGAVPNDVMDALLDERSLKILFKQTAKKEPTMEKSTMKTAEQMRELAQKANRGDNCNKKLLNGILRGIEKAAKKGVFLATIDLYGNDSEQEICQPIIAKLKDLGYKVSSKYTSAPPIVGREDEACRTIKISW